MTDSNDVLRSLNRVALQVRVRVRGSSQKKGNAGHRKGSQFVGCGFKLRYNEYNRFQYDAKYSTFGIDFERGNNDVVRRKDLIWCHRLGHHEMAGIYWHYGAPTLKSLICITANAGESRNNAISSGACMGSLYAAVVHKAVHDVGLRSCPQS